MSERNERFEVRDDPDVEVELSSGALRVLGGPPNTIAVDIRGPEAGRFDVRCDGRTVRVRLEGGYGRRWHSHEVTLTVPTATALRARVASGDVSVETDLARLEVHSGSGGVTARRVAGDVVARTASGHLKLGSAGGHVRLSSASGDLEVGSSAGSVVVNTAGGDVRVGRAAGALSIRSASGAVSIDSYEGADLSCATVTGDVSVGIAAGRTIDLDLFSLAGSIDNEFTVDTAGQRGGGEGGAGRVSVRSTAGDIALRRAAR